MADMVDSRRELREVTVEVKYDYELGTVSKTRTDTGEVISTREMTDQERQAEIEFHDANDVIEDTRAAERAEEEDQGEDETPADEPDTTDSAGEAPAPVEEDSDEDADDDDDDWNLDDDEGEDDDG